MAACIIEQIAVVIQDRIKAVTVANSYNVTVKEVIRPSRYDEISLQNYSVLMMQTTADPLDTSLPGNPAASLWQEQFSISMYITPSEKSNTPIDTLVNEFRADVIKGITVSGDTSDWSQWDSLGHSSEFGGVSYIGDETDNAIVGIQQDLLVNYRTDENDPYTKR